MASEHVDQDNLMDHEYDGIREYDNPLPGWWVWTWVATILFCIPYWLYYQTADGNTIHDEYIAEMNAFKGQMSDAFGDLEANEQTILKYMTDPAALATMKGVFAARCVACHLDDGRGLVGPNLTDDYWISVKTLPDIAKVITNGVVEKGMISWKGILTDTQIVLMSSYVASLRANAVEGRAPQGEIIPPWPTDS